MTHAFRFLAGGRFDPLAAVTWTNEWLAPPQGLVAHRAGDLPHWLAPELWRVELGGQVVERDVSLLAERGRLVEQIAAWDLDACDAFIRWCRERHPEVGDPAEVSWCSACSAGYEASQIAGMRAPGGAGYEQAEAGERALQAAWVADRAGLG